MVIINDSIACFLFPVFTLWWVTVTQLPDHINITEFSNGNPQGLIAFTPAGGQDTPISGEGDNDACKYAQKKDTKNITSDNTNKKKPNFNVYTILNVWAPW